MITHVVLFKLKDSSPESIYKAEQVLRSLEGRVPVIRSIEVGVDVLRSQRSYDICLTVKFDTLEDLEAYQSHPEHVLVADYIGSVRESVAVVDYEGR
ncbi:MAG: Dabb family protein [Deltaproteobacteria bacterium]|nr:Dabb family protein [Deltaproteobacteria bacterium]